MFSKVKAAIITGAAGALLTALVVLQNAFWPDMLTAEQETAVLGFLAAVGGLIAGGAAYLKTENTGYSKVKQPAWYGPTDKELEALGGSTAEPAPVQQDPLV